ncbi:MAG: ComF family protein [Eubacteriales bacterium]|nr:ComF family protein [Eubacteriales bacterium]
MSYSLTDCLFPPRCPICGEIMTVNEKLENRKAHEACEKSLDFSMHSFKNLNASSFDDSRSLLYYEGKARDMMFEIKSGGMRDYCTYLGELTWKRLGDWIKSLDIECMIPVPVSDERKRVRGYNQAEEIAMAISERSGIPVNTSILVRVPDTAALKTLGPEERLLNLKNAFKVTRKVKPGTGILLIDDIYTTGATMGICAHLLRIKAGAERIYALSVTEGKV